jgi:hypothetical protein
MSFRKKAEFLVDEIDGLTLEDVDDIYEEWAGMDFDRSNFGYDQALAALWDIAYKRSLERLGRYDAYKERIRAQVEQKEQE